MRAFIAEGILTLRNPTEILLVARCPRATSGQSDAKPAMALMKSRLRTQSSNRAASLFSNLIRCAISGKGDWSALGQKQTCAVHRAMSAKCHKRTSRQAIIVVELALLVSLRYGAEIIGPMLGRAKPVL